MTTTPLILPFSSIRAADLPLVGGKGANLGEMTAAGFPIPPGFCLTTAAFQQFMDACPEADNLYEKMDALAADDVDGVRVLGEQVRQTLLSVPIPDAVATAAREQWRALDPEAAYAVRSSATAEDLPDASFAGQQDTYLNIIGEDTLLDAVRRCWVSLFTDRAILYRAQNNFPHREVQLSVVVQQMVMSEKSGILFTADPVTGHRHTVSIDASFGLGEALVSGIVSPDLYKVDKRGPKIIERQIAQKQVAIFPEKDGGTRQETLPPKMQSQTVLSDDEILALAKLGAAVEAHYGKPQDIEWGMADGELYLLQSRPITSLYPIDGLKSPDGTLHIYFSMGHQQGMTRAMSPFSLSSFQVLAPFGHDKSRFDNRFIRISGGHMFADITQPLRHPIFRRLIFNLLVQFDALAPQSLQMAMRRPEFQGPHGLHLSFSVLKFMGRIMHRVLGTLLWRDMTGFTRRTNDLIDGFIQDVPARLNAVPPGKTQLETMLDILDEAPSFMLHWVPEAAAGIAATRILPRVASRWLSPQECEAITLGIPGNVVNEMNIALGDLADLARQSPQLAAHFDNLGDDAHTWLAEAAKIDGSAPFMQAWKTFLEHYGARGPSEIDIMMPRWHEDPLPILRVIAGYLDGDETTQRARFNTFVAERETVYRKLQAAAGHGPRAWLVKRLYRVMTEVGGMREHHKFYFVRIIAEIKKVLKGIARLLVENGKLAQSDDIWFLRWAELFSIWDDDATDWQALITQRRADFERYQKMTPSMIITSDGEAPVAQYSAEDAPPGAILGNPVSAGVVEGVAHVIRDPQRETLAPGEILVAEATDPGWTPLFINAAGLILEVGGVLTHGAVVAREYGIPAVVGVRDATQKIQTGQRVRVDGNRGVIEIL